MHLRQIKPTHTAGIAGTETQCIQDKLGPHKQLALQGHRVYPRYVDTEHTIGTAGIHSESKVNEARS
jgi:hypothetical protein